MALRAEPWIQVPYEPREVRSRGWFRSSARDAFPFFATVAQGWLLVLLLGWVAPTGWPGAVATALYVALGMAWGSNSVSHIHLHAPLFRSRRVSSAYGLYLTALLGIPQTLWRRRHLWHHAGEPQTVAKPWSPRMWLELGVVLVVMAAIAWASPRAWSSAYLPGYLLGLLFCRVQGDMEHAATGDPQRGVSHYGWLYNLLWFNDGYHAEHHEFPSAHWTRLPEMRRRVSAAQSTLPPLLRPLEQVAPALGQIAWVARGLCALERLALASPLLQRFMLRTHLRAIRVALGALPRPPRHITIVGGGLFPRTALVLSEVFPEARLRVVDRSAASIARAERYLATLQQPPRLSFELASFDPLRHAEDDLVVVPLAFVGEKELLREVRSRTALLTHDWIWSRQGLSSRVVSWLLLKRVNLSLPYAAR
ncbi:MAG: fatty acid desaturase [Polyangiaceae bacterium]